MISLLIFAFIILIAFAGLCAYVRKHFYRLALKKWAFWLYQGLVSFLILFQITWAIFLAWDLSVHNCHEFCNGYDAVGRAMADFALMVGLGFFAIMQGALFFAVPKQMPFARWKTIAGVSATALPLVIYFAFWWLV